MPIEYHVRPEPSVKAKTLRALFSKEKDSILVDSADIKIVPNGDMGDRLITVTSKNDDDEVYEMVCNQQSIVRLANWLNIPAPFIKRVDHDIQEWLFETMLDRPSREVLLTFTEEEGILEMNSPALDSIDPRKMIDLVLRALGDDALVLDHMVTTKEYRFDVIQKPAGAEDEIVVGLRFGQDVQHRLAPWVSLILYFPSNTNIIEIPGVTRTMDGRKMTNAEVLIALEGEAQHAVDKALAKIAAVRDLANQPVTDATQFFMRIGREGGVNQRVLASAAQRLPSMVTSTHHTNMLEVIHAMANEGTRPDLWDRPNPRRKIELACGSVIQNHADRCPTCLGMVAHPIDPEDLMPPEEEY